MRNKNFQIVLLLFISSCWLLSCSSPLLEWTPDPISDTSTVTITCNAEKGNQGLNNFQGPVFIHIGLITDSSQNSIDWRYVKFKWGTINPAAEAKKVGKNKWSYTIPDIRKFFDVNENERILEIAILFRSGNCYDTDCSVLRNEDNSDMFIPVSETLDR